MSILSTLLLTVVQPAVAQDHLTGTRSEKWGTHVIPVCWENANDGNAWGRDRTRKAVMDSWQANTRLEFVGWGACSANAKGIRIRIEDAGPHTKGVGRSLDGKVDGMVLNFTFENWSRSCRSKKEICIDDIAVHEFGHALGFTHEQNRPDTPDWCLEENNAQGTTGDTLITRWDTHSIMNYCNPDNYTQRTLLTPSDIAGAQSWYGKGAPIDPGYGHLFQAFADVDGDGRDDFCRFVGDPHRPWLACWTDHPQGDLPSAQPRTASQYAFRSVDGIDRGHDHLPRALVDVNGDKRADFCRFVGDGGSEFLSCNLAEASGFSSKQYGFNSAVRPDLGHGHLPRGLADVNGDGRADFCRFVGDGGQRFLSCNLAETSGFSARLYGFSSVEALDAGYDSLPRMFADVNGDGRDDFCRFVGDGGRPYLACNLAEEGGFSRSQYGFRSGEGIDTGHAHMPRALVDVNGDRRADWCRFVGNDAASYYSCMLAEGGGFSSKQYGVNSRQGLYPGRGDHILGFADGNGDGIMDACGMRGPDDKAWMSCISGSNGMQSAYAWGMAARR